MVNFVRVMSSRYLQTPLGFSGGPSRFGPLPSSPDLIPLFGIIYVAEDLATAVYETLVRDRFDLNPSRILMPPDYAERAAVNVSTAAGQMVTLLDLTGGNAVRHGVPTDVIRYSIHTDGQYFSEFVYANMPAVDGFLYQSRLTEQFCIAVYDRALAKLTTGQVPLPLTRPVLAQALEPWNIRVR